MNLFAIESVWTCMRTLVFIALLSTTAHADWIDALPRDPALESFPGELIPATRADGDHILVTIGKPHRKARPVDFTGETHDLDGIAIRMVNIYVAGCSAPPLPGMKAGSSPGTFLIAQPIPDVILAPRSDLPVFYAPLSIDAGCPVDGQDLLTRTLTAPAGALAEPVVVVRDADELAGAPAGLKGYQLAPEQMLVVQPGARDLAPREPPLGTIRVVHERVLTVPEPYGECQLGPLLRTTPEVAPDVIYRIPATDRTISVHLVPTAVPDPACTGDEAPAKVLSDDGRTMVVGFEPDSDIFAGEDDEPVDARPVREGGKLVITLRLSRIDHVQTDCSRFDEPCDPVHVEGASGALDYAPLYRHYRLPHTRQPVILRVVDGG